ncbi:hypothetical protein [Tepidiforma sp.]|uniref:Ppx/GppA phosphatase family protein n=1 Tax=Tepidiforma sp. TaxID=2682230 RepID=UPI0026304ED6|nr:hypothetical protein [Tepidiforma sp.]MCX7617713.1 hypothetical protein [Tepidiforma sp.]
MAGGGRQERRAVIDIGSDTVHLVIGRLVPGPGGGPAVETLESHSVLLELGLEVARYGRIDPRDLRGLEAVVTRFAAKARREAGHLVIGATEASRRAANGGEVLAELAQRVGEPIRLLSGVREAQLGVLGVRARLDERGEQLVVDSGGASTELSLTSGREVWAAASLGAGAAALRAAMPGDPPGPLTWALGAAAAGMALAAAPPGRPAKAWATGGTAHHLVRLERKTRNRKPAALTMGEMERLSGELLRKPAEKLGRRRKQDPRRVALLAPGVLILAAVLRHYGLERCTVLPEGVREGMLLASALEGETWWQDRAGEGRGGGEEERKAAGA